MAITQSVMSIYEDQAKTSLVTVKTTLSDDTSIEIDGLDPGKEYWASVVVTDDAHLSSVPSTAYQFFTVPNVIYYNGGTVGAGDTWMSAQLEGVTDTVQIAEFGLVYDTDIDFSHPTYYSEPMPDVTVWNLPEHTTYYVAPFIIDEFGRRYVNWDLAVTVTTLYSKPTINWTGDASVTTSSYTAAVNVESLAPLTAVTVMYGIVGGTQETMSLTASTGIQTFTLSNLVSGTLYTVKVRATNSAGYKETSIQAFMTEAAAATVNISTSSINSSNNEITATAFAHLNGQAAAITGLYIDLYDNNTHTGSAHETIGGSAVQTYTGTFTTADPDELYYVFGRVTYTVGNDPTIFTSWSAPVQINTYSLLSFGNITTTNYTATVPYAVSGEAYSVEIAYSPDNIFWVSLPISSLSGGTLTLNGLSENTTYQIKGRAQSDAGWQNYVTTSFTTTEAAPHLTISSISSVSDSSATVNISYY